MVIHASRFKRTPRLFLSFALPSFLVVISSVSWARTTISAESALERYQLSTGEDALLQYLAVGVPADFSGDFNERWDAYRFAAGALSEKKSPRVTASLIRLLQDPIPAPLLRDLLLKVSTDYNNHTWDNWNLEILKNTFEFRAACAYSLANTGDDTALPALLDYLADITEIMDHQLDVGHADPTLLSAYSSTCYAITTLGDKAGIDTTIGDLDRLTRHSPELTIYFLRLSTGQSFGPDYQESPRTRAFEIKKWQEWWQQNRDTFNFVRQDSANLPYMDQLKPIPDTLRDHVATVSVPDVGGGGYRSQSEKWLTENGTQHTADFKAIVGDKAEAVAVRSEATKWYAQVVGDDSLKLLLTYATDDNIYRDDITARPWLQRSAFGLICKHFPANAADVAKVCLLSEDPVSDNAAYFLMQESEHHKYVAEIFPKIKAVNGRLVSIQRLLHLSEPIGRTAFFDAVKDSRVSIASYGAQGIEKFGLETELPAESREALEKWRNNPQFIIDKIMKGSLEGQERIDAVQSALSLVDVTDPYASRIYYEGWRILPEDSRDAAMEGILRCVEYFNTNHNR